jgi:beta-carotene hydroxylase
MSKPESAERVAQQAATRYMGGVAWPTVILAVVAAATYVGTLLLVVGDQMSLAPAVIILALASYATYTVLHEAAHGSISGNQRGMRWLNEALGYLAAWVLLIPMTAHRHEHLAHHRHANMPDDDPDYCVRDFARSPWHAATVAAQVLYSQFRYYLTHRWGRGRRSQDIYLVAEVLSSLLLRLPLLLWGDWSAGLLAMVLGLLLGVSITLYLFAYLVHRPHADSGRWVDTSTIPMAGVGGAILSFAWGYQNYHGIHHLFPRVPWYRYPRLYRDIAEPMQQMGAPIYQLDAAGLRRAPALA